MSKQLKKLRFDNNNVPILKPFEVEERAEYLLNLFCDSSLHNPQPTDLPKIVKPLTEKYAVKIFFKEDLGLTKDGRKIRGRIAPLKRHIWIDKTLETEIHRLRFTIAHEIGHLALHRHRPIQNYTEIIEDTNKELRMVEFDHSGSSKNIVEWQANRYAASMLMPRYTVSLFLLNLHKEERIHRYIGQIYVDNSPTNRRLYSEALSHLSLTYNVSKTVAQIRLEELGLLIDKRESHIRTLVEEFRDLHIS
jgi:hypothetical protein